MTIDKADAIKLVDEAIKKERIAEFASELREADNERKREILREITNIRKVEPEEDSESLLVKVAEWIKKGGELSDLRASISPSEVSANAELVRHDINILGFEYAPLVDQPHCGYLSIEFKWWYGESPSESRWQRTLLRVDNHSKELVTLVISKVDAIRLQIEQRTGVSQNVRH